LIHSLQMLISLSMGSVVAQRAHSLVDCILVNQDAMDQDTI
jgi:hypothetical protein